MVMAPTVDSCALNVQLPAHYSAIPFSPLLAWKVGSKQVVSFSAWLRLPSSSPVFSIDFLIPNTGYVLLSSRDKVEYGQEYIGHTFTSALVNYKYAFDFVEEWSQNNLLF